jgi:hypothetical protein
VGGTSQSRGDGRGTFATWFDNHQDSHALQGKTATPCKARQPHALQGSHYSPFMACHSEMALRKQRAEVCQTAWVARPRARGDGRGTFVTCFDNHQDSHALQGSHYSPFRACHPEMALRKQRAEVATQACRIACDRNAGNTDRISVKSVKKRKNSNANSGCVSRDGCSNPASASGFTMPNRR